MYKFDKNSTNLIGELELHDQSLNSIDIDFLNQKICYGIDIYNENIKDYDNIELNFVGVKNLKMDELLISEITDLTIVHLKIEQNKDERICNFTFLENNEGGIIQMNFTFIEVHRK